MSPRRDTSGLHQSTSSTIEERRARFDDMEPSSRRRRVSSRVVDAEDYREHVGGPRERRYPQRSPSRRRESFNSYTPIDPYASYIPPPPYFLPPVLRQSSIYGSRPPPPPSPVVRSTYRENMMPYSPAYYDQYWDTPDELRRDPPEEEPDGVQVDFSALQSVRNVSEKTAATLMPSVDAVTLVCANVSRVLYLRTDDLQSKAGASTAEIENTAAELSGFAMVLGNMRQILESTSQVISETAFENMNALLIYCKKALQKIQSVITTSRKTPSRLNFLKRNSLNSSLSKAKPVRLNLECLKTSLTAMISTIILAGRQNKRHEVQPDTHIAASSLDTLVNNKDTDPGSETSEVTYELDAAVERITSKLENDIFANSRAVKRWQEAERRDFDEMYTRNIVPDNASPVSPASQWISTLVPFQPATAYMKRITGPVVPKAISYGNEEIVASGSRSQINENEEQARISAVIQVLLGKWTESQPGAKVSNHKSAISGSPESFDNLGETRSEKEEKHPLDGEGVLGDHILEIQHHSLGHSPLAKRTKHVSFQDADEDDHHNDDLISEASAEPTQESDSERQDGVSTDPNSINRDNQTSTPNTDDLPNIDHMKGSAKTGQRSERGIYDAKERYMDNYINSINTKKDDPDDLPKTGWEQADDMTSAFRISDRRRDPSLYGLQGAQFRNVDTKRYYAGPQDPGSIAMFPYEDPYGYGQGMTRPSPYSPANYYPPPPAARPSVLTSDEEEPPRSRGFAETIHSSSRDPSRGYSRLSQPERYSTSGRYSGRRNSFSKGNSDSEEENATLNDNSKSLVLRGNPLSTVLKELQIDLQEARAMVEEKDAELMNSIDVERFKRLETDLNTAIEDQKETQAAAERRAAADERNSVAKADQIVALEASNTTQAEQIFDLDANLIAADAKVTTLEARLTRRDATIERLKREGNEENAEPLDDEIVEVVEEVDEADGKAAPRRRASSEFSYYTNSDRMPKQDRVWQLAQAIIILLSLALGMSAVLATYIHSDNGDVMLKVLRVIGEQTPEFTLQAKSILRRGVDVVS